MAIVAIEVEDANEEIVVIEIAQGADGAAGQGVPTGGTTGQYLKKSSATDYDTEWANVAGGGDALVSGTLAQFAATTSAQLAGVISDETGSGALVFANSPTLVTPALGTPASGTLTNCTGLPPSTGLSTTVPVSKGGTGLTAVGTALQVLRTNAGATALEFATISSGAGDALTTNPLSQFAATTSAQLAGVVSDETGTGALVFANSPTLVTPALGTPASGTLTNCTGLPVASGVSGLGTGVATFLATPTSANLAAAVTNETGSGALVFATSPTFVTPALGTPASGALTNCTAVPAGQIVGVIPIANLATGTPDGTKFIRDDGSLQAIPGGGDALTSSSLAQFAATTSLELKGVISDETGSGALVFANSPTLVTPALGTPSAAVLTNATGLPISTGVSGLGTGVATVLATPSSANLAAAITDETGSGALVFATSPTLVTPAIGTPSSGTLTNCTGLPTTGLVDAAVTLAKMANLAQDQFIGRTTASTGVPETATITAAARTVLDDTTVAAMVDTLGGASSTGTGGIARATSPAFTTPNIGTPSAGTLTNCTGLPVSTGVSGLGTGVGTFLATPTSANLASAVTDETGTGALVFANSPTLVTPALGTPASGTLTSCTIKTEWSACFSDETTALTTGTKLTKRLGFAMSLTSVYASVATAPTGSTLILDIKKNGTTIFSTKITIDAGEKSTATAATAAVLSSSPTSIAADDELTFILDQVGATIAGAGGSVVLIGTRS
jgi:hypothetical protein